VISSSIFRSRRGSRPWHERPAATMHDRRAPDPGCRTPPGGHGHDR
jgi:hypothetical protein